MPTTDIKQPKKIDFERYPLTKSCFDYILEHYPLYEKTYQYILKNFDEAFYLFAEKLLCAIEKKSNGRPGLLCSLDNFINISREFALLQARLIMSGKYEASSSEERNQNLYQNKEDIRVQMDGLLVSQIFWPNHYHFGQYFTETCRLIPRQAKILDAPCGDGIFSYYLGKNFSLQQLYCIDISPYCIQYTKELLSAADLDPSAITFIAQDILQHKNKEKFDFIICGELLEHLENPKALLAKIKSLLNPHGKVFLTTAIYCAAVDHIYLFENVDEARNLIKEYFHIESELILPTTLKPYSEGMNREPINYACVLKSHE